MSCRGTRSWTARSARSLQAKKDLPAGEILDGIGGYASCGIAENYAEFVRDGLLSMGLSEGCRLKRPLAKDQVVTFDDVEIPSGRLIDRLYDEQQAAFPIAAADAA